MTRLKLIFAAILILFAFKLYEPTLGFALTEREWASAINVSGRQRMLSQKMTKEFLFIAANVEGGANSQELQRTIKLFDLNLGQLFNGNADLNIPPPPTPEIKAQLEKVKMSWESFRNLLTAEAAKLPIPAESLAKVANNSAELLKEMQSAVELYEVASVKAGIKSVGKRVNIAGRQRMLTQK